jgi:TolA-binding protein
MRHRARLIAVTLLVALAVSGCHAESTKDTASVDGVTADADAQAKAHEMHIQAVIAKWRRTRQTIEQRLDSLQARVNRLEAASAKP